MKKRLTYALGLIIACIIAVVTVLPVCAAGVIDINRDVEFTISYQTGDLPISGARFDLYRIAEVDAYARMTVTERFSHYPIELDVQEQSEWDVLAMTLKGYVWADALLPELSGETAADGALTATVKPGLYLVVGYRRTIGEDTYSVVPFLVFLPGLDAEQNVWEYTVVSKPKAVVERNPADDPNDRLISRKVLKIWDDAGKESGRPQEIVIQLLCDGLVYDTVTLHSGNNWRYAWDNLEREHEWLVTEKRVEGYTQAVAQEGITFTVKNTVIPERPADPVKPPPSRLPQTGLLWWPVIPLVALGLLFLAIGLCRRKGEKHE